MQAIEPGVRATRRVLVDEARTIDFLGDALRVYATPALVRDIEETCRTLLLEYAGPEETSVGTGIDLTHSAATPLGMNVEITVAVAGVDGRRVDFQVVARDQAEEIGRGEHSRVIVPVAKLGARVAAKAAKAAAG